MVVAAAGNDGKDQGAKVYGHIHSPGNEPSAITVGAVNGFGTDSRADDKVATYSSRGPTRSYWTDAYGVKHYDNLIKPDLVAIGNKLIFAESTNSSASPATNKLLGLYPQLDASLYPTSNMKQMYLNGSSVASPVVAGGAAATVTGKSEADPKSRKNDPDVYRSTTQRIQRLRAGRRIAEH